MQVNIEYCVPCGYLPRAEQLAAELEKKYGAATELVKGEKGIFDVYVDGKLIFSRHQEGRFPEPQDIFDKVGAAG